MLDHAFDDQHDIEPVHFHEHAIHRAFDHPESHSYHEHDYEHSFEHDGKFSDLGYLAASQHHGYDEYHHAPDYEKHHEEHHVEHDHHYNIDIAELPQHHQQRFDVEDETRAHAERSFLPKMHFVVEEPMHAAAHHETLHGHSLDGHSAAHDRVVEYVVGEDGHVHTYEQFNQNSAFLQ